MGYTSVLHCVVAAKGGELVSIAEDDAAVLGVGGRGDPQTA
jgi:hypothetical protein